VSLGKKYIINCISSKASISNSSSSDLLEHFLETIKLKKGAYEIKISNFGTFYNHKTIQRIGRNPKTKEKFLIKSRNKLSFRSSSYLKKIIN
jgi:nucleoid DNA-binding protein